MIYVRNRGLNVKIFYDKLYLNFSLLLRKDDLNGHQI